MSERIELARKAYAALNRDDWETLAELLSPDLEVQRAGGLGTIAGFDETRDFRAPDAFEWQREEPAGEFIERGERLFIALRSHARGVGSAIELEQPVYHVITFRDGKVVRLEIYFDRAEALRALESE